MSNYTTLLGPGDQCVCGAYHGCRCRPEPEFDRHWQGSYQAGYEACEADGYSERPLAEWVYRTFHRARWCPTERRVVYAMTAERYGELTWRRHHRTEAAYARWFERQYGFDLGAYLAGYDDAGAGLPSAVADPERHALLAAALDAYEPMPDLYEEPVGPWSLADVEDGLPF